MARYLITAAGGNATAVEELDEARGYDFNTRVRRLMARWNETEQAGFLLRRERRFMMAGGEFCGNAVRAAAVLLNNFQTGEVQLRTSGYRGMVRVNINKLSADEFYVAAGFSNMKIKTERTTWRSYAAEIVDLVGIVHVVISASPPEGLKRIQSQIIRELNLVNQPAVGVIWLTRRTNGVEITPVVWVRDVDTTFIETACGSGAIAAAVVSGRQEIFQPTGQAITVSLSPRAVSLASTIKILESEDDE
jgi:diaminopimelate epimerase